MRDPLLSSPQRRTAQPAVTAGLEKKPLTGRRSSSLQPNTWLNRHMAEEGMGEGKEDTEGQRWSKWHTYSHEEKEYHVNYTTEDDVRGLLLTSNRRIVWDSTCCIVYKNYSSFQTKEESAFPFASGTGPTCTSMQCEIINSRLVSMLTW